MAITQPPSSISTTELSPRPTVAHHRAAAAAQRPECSSGLAGRPGCRAKSPVPAVSENVEGAIGSAGTARAAGRAAQRRRWNSRVPPGFRRTITPHDSPPLRAPARPQSLAKCRCARSSPRRSRLRPASRWSVCKLRRKQSYASWQSRLMKNVGPIIERHLVQAEPLSGSPPAQRNPLAVTAHFVYKHINTDSAGAKHGNHPLEPRG